MASKTTNPDNMELAEAEDCDERTNQRNTARCKTCQAVTFLFALLALALSIFVVYIVLFSNRENTKTSVYNTTSANLEELQKEIKQAKDSLKALSTRVGKLEKSLETSQHSTETEFSQVWEELVDIKSRIKNQPKNGGGVKVLKNYLILPTLFVFCLNIM